MHDDEVAAVQNKSPSAPENRISVEVAAIDNHMMKLLGVGARFRARPNQTEKKYPRRGTDLEAEKIVVMGPGRDGQDRAPGSDEARHQRAHAQIYPVLVARS